MRNNMSRVTDAATMELVSTFIEQDGKLSDRDIDELINLAKSCVSIIEMGVSRNKFLELKEAFESCIR